MDKLTDAKAQLLSIIDEVDVIDRDDKHLSIAIIDLIVSCCNFALVKLSSIQPVTTSLGTMLLDIELLAVKHLEGVALKPFYDQITKEWVK